MDFGGKAIEEDWAVDWGRLGSDFNYYDKKFSSLCTYSYFWGAH